MTIAARGRASAPGFSPIGAAPGRTLNGGRKRRPMTTSPDLGAT